jgi:hypothetical protein
VARYSLGSASPNDLQNLPCSTPRPKRRPTISGGISRRFLP